MICKNEKLKIATEDCLKMCDELQIPYKKIRKVTINYRAKKRWGFCKQVDGQFNIEISNRLLNEDADEKALKTTILHEILHTVPGCMNHGRAWKYYAGILNQKFGYNIKRTTSAKEKGVEDISVTLTPKHKFVCQKCNAEVVRYKESKFTQNHTKYSCAVCGGRFKMVF